MYIARVLFQSPLLLELDLSAPLGIIGWLI